MYRPAVSIDRPLEGFATARGRRMILAGVVCAHLAALWLLFWFGLADGGGTQRGVPAGLRTVAFDFAAQPSAAERRRKGMEEGADQVPLPLGLARADNPARGTPDAADRQDIAGEQSALAQAVAGALADDPMAAGQGLNYRAQLIAHIRRFLFYPPEALRRGLSGTVVVRFRIDRAGQVIDLRVLRTRGAVLDTAAMDAIWKAEPLPAVPAAIQAPWEVDVPIDFTPPPRLR